MDKNKDFVIWFNDLSIEDVPVVGGKNASLGEMYRELSSKGVSIPNGFAVTAHAYRHLLEETGAKDKIKEILSDLDTTNMDNLAERGHKVRELIRSLEFPLDLRNPILEAYSNLCKEYGENTDCAVRSSATAEDLPDASFAGQQETYLNVHGGENIIEACKKCFASLFTNRAISYRVDKNFDHFSIALSIGVQKMVRSDRACSGVMFSIDTESGFKDAIFITGSYGLGENIVLGVVNPDEYYVFKPTLKQGFRPIIKKSVGDKKMKMIYTTDQKTPTKNVEVPVEDQKKFVLTDDEILALAKMGQTIEDHYSEKRNKFTPMDMEWAKDGITNKLYIVQARPETVHSQKDHSKLKEYKLQEKGELIVPGKSVGQKIGAGTAHVIKDAHQINQFKKGEVLITDMTDPDWEPIMKIASAIVTNRGGRTCFDGNTKILTNNGFMTFNDIEKTGYNGLLTLSFNKETKKTEWKPIVALMKKQSPRIKISVSQSGKITDNSITLTPDHNMINIRNSQIVKTQIQDILSSNEMLCVAQHAPQLSSSNEKQNKLAYLLGGIMTDGSVYKTRTHGEVQFIQKRVPEKMQFIEHMNYCLSAVYNKSFVPYEKQISSGFIRGKPAVGQATAYRLYSKQIAYDMFEQEQAIVKTLLSSDTEVAYNFLAGAIDGDGSFFNNRIQIYVSDNYLLEGIVTSCLRIGILPQVTKNRNIYNVQIVENLKEILSHTKRVKGEVRDREIETRFFSAKQILDENVKGQLKLRRDNNLYIGEKSLRELNNPKINSLLDSDIRMLRAVDCNEISYGDVYNITVEDNHTYLVFTEKYTPLVVCNCHAAIISRELGIPCVVGTINGTEKIPTGENVTVDCSNGDIGYVYKGILKYNINEIDLGSIPKTKTKIMMNIGNPEQAFEQSFIPNEGVGLAREEFIINSYIKVHPLALMNYNELKDTEARKIIEDLTYNWSDKSQFFVDKLAEGIATIASAFYPKKVIVRLSDFKSNEYANLIGGREFEPKEDNPMIGWRGASRYYDPKYKAGFGLECKAFLKVRNEMGLTNVEVMIPFPRTVKECHDVIWTMGEFGLRHNENGLKIIGMCEIPSNVILADEFLDVVDGFSIGTNDLTQLTLGVDRDSELVAHVYDERNDAVKKLVKQVIETCNRRDKYIGICGQAPSDYPEFARFVVECGIGTMSLNPDTVIKTTFDIAELEKRLGIKAE
ncbi:MAG: phosphoenolpyruvate synthase [Candidatus Nanoarchaeia archaeon]